MFRKEALPFAAGFATALGIIGMIWLVNLEEQQRFNIMDHPRVQVLEGKAYMRDAWMTKVTLTIRTKENLHTPFMEMEAREFIGSLAAQYMSTEFDALSLKFQEDTIKYLGLPCSAMLVNVSMTTPE